LFRETLGSRPAFLRLIYQFYITIANLSITIANIAILKNMPYTVCESYISDGYTTMGFKTHLKTLIINHAAKTGNIIAQKEIFEATGISQATLSRWYKGDIEKLDYDTALKLTRFFECGLCDLVSLGITSED
jgi:DNA-binding Xre family transcriptional regulator